MEKLEVNGTDSLGNTVVATVVEEKKESGVNINDLPVELLINVFSRLDPIQLNSLRLVCKYWNNTVSYRTTWTKSFALKFGSGDVFPSLTCSRIWITEYFSRLKVYKKWQKSITTHTSYQLLNNEYRYIDSSLTSFSRNKLLTFSALNGNIAICNLDNGKNQSFIPGNDVFKQITSFSINWTYVLIGQRTGELYLKNHVIANTSGSIKSSLTMIIDFENSQNDPITATALNPSSGKSGDKIHFISASHNGVLRLWGFDKKIYKEINLHKAIIDVSSDFKKFVICQTYDIIYIIDLMHLDMTEIKLDFVVLDGKKSFMDVDYADNNIILSYGTYIRVFHFKDLQSILIRERNFTSGETTLKACIQSINPARLRKRDVSIPGADGLFYANVLSDSTVFVWNVRDLSKEIIPQCQINPTFNLYSPYVPPDLPTIRSVALNSSVICIGGYNGFTNLHNIFTGKFMKECSAKFPKRYTQMSNELIPVNNVHLNEDQSATNGVIICGDTQQYFQFGINEKINTQGPKKKLNNGPSNKLKNQIKIKNEIEDYDIQMELEKQQEILFNKYNGEYSDEEEELSVALAISESYSRSRTSTSESNELIDEELTRVLAMSEREQLHLDESEEVDLNDDEQLRRALELSLIDQ